MESSRLARRLAAVAGGVTIVAMVGLTASCAKRKGARNHDHDDHHYDNARHDLAGRAAVGEEHQPHWGQPVHAAGLCAPGADRTARSASQ